MTLTQRQVVGLVFIAASILIAIFASRFRDANEELQALFGFQRPRNHWARGGVIQRLYAIPPFATGVYLLLSPD